MISEISALIYEIEVLSGSLNLEPLFHEIEVQNHDFGNTAQTCISKRNSLSGLSNPHNSAFLDANTKLSTVYLSIYDHYDTQLSYLNILHVFEGHQL